MAKLLIDRVLKKRKMSRYRFAKELNTNYGNIHRFFKPEYDPKLSMLESWARVLKCRIRDLYSE